ncbi:cell division protein FtsZ [Dinghuibacter silviterrae]|uniref:Cell division protein FtsZ n=1 Tax=Dinghuibacter silviterrae TaxID=1539049 RepID=A0A4R8DQ52_9BACT|nr:cell division protein FtsZ [Dinghuibacter silviterrae]TDX00252.1 cell division protein FtsZ [Dinghuibacter silviterrae]
MIHFDLPKEKSSIIKVIGIGGGGSNAVNFMHGQGIEGVNFIICNTDAQAIANSKVPNKIQLGPHLTQGLGAGANPEIGRQATEESLEEIRRILEVNTKMAFITAGMGGGTGTGGAPIVARICKEMGILTVGIITTPFTYEGKKRIQQGEEGINRLKDHVDTLLVISNDKLRHQYGNLKMKEAFAKADNVLATAAKCITDVINSTGQINVDFADVCTVMRNGGVAILGSGAAEGDNRAQRAIEQALNSPLLNDNDIRGAKWILININSAEGEHEFTMDEVDIIQNYLLSQAGPNSDVIMGLGYDSSLQGKIGITLIATGFEHEGLTADEKAAAMQAPIPEEKIVMTLQMETNEKKPNGQQALFAEPGRATAPSAAAPAPAAAIPPPDSMAPSLVEPAAPAGDFFISRVDNPKAPAKEEKIVMPLQDLSAEVPPTVTRAEVPPAAARAEAPKPAQPQAAARPATGTPDASKTPVPPSRPTARPDTTGRGFLARPSNIYDEEPQAPKPTPSFPEEAPTFDMQLVIKDQPSQPRNPQPVLPYTPEPTQPGPDEMDEQRRKAAERLQKLRNLSFNVNAPDGGNEFEAVPAYVRRNMELYNTVNSIENFYSNYTVKSSEDNKGEISTINTFLEGKKPD